MLGRWDDRPSNSAYHIEDCQTFDHSTFLPFEIYHSLLCEAAQDKVQKAQIISLSCSKHVSQHFQVSSNIMEEQSLVAATT